MTDIDLGWLAGILEGEGSFMAGPPASPNRTILSAITTDYDVAERVAAFLGTHTTSYRTPEQPHYKQAYVVRITGARARAWMDKLRPLMGARRQAAIDRAIQSFVPGGRYRTTALTMEQADRVREELK